MWLEFNVGREMYYYANQFPIFYQHGVGNNQDRFVECQGLQQKFVTNQQFIIFNFFRCFDQISHG